MNEASRPAPPCPTCGHPLTAPSACEWCEGEILAVDGVRRSVAGNRFFLIEFAEGFACLFRACLLLMTKKEYLGKLGLAVAVNLVAVVVFGAGTFYAFLELFGSITGTGQDDAVALIPLIAALIATWLVAGTLIAVGMMPFLDPIADATEKMLGGEGMPSIHIGFHASLGAGLSAAAQILVVQILVLVPLLLLTLTLAISPLASMVVLPAAALVSAYLNALVWFEIPVLRRGYGMDYRRRVVRRNWARAIGFGLAFDLALFVPFFNLIFLAPATAVAVSLLYFRFEKAV